MLPRRGPKSWPLRKQAHPNLFSLPNDLACGVRGSGGTPRFWRRDVLLWGELSA
jgi:hypothetical protein